MSAHLTESVRIDLLTIRHTAFRHFGDLLDARGGYYPSLHTRSWKNRPERAELLEIADAYDAAQTKREDSRRAYRS